ncbi:unnamed protein product [Protopolystoma xenopodis]|uniref:Uncharacterized protein n=1 Tax=Protopolystoma xenopodis TaxID=117903 RepID=A0A3S5AWA3_9PLAT|nr:unnamed protein product [Protopolystoma xenopodis]
MIHKSCALWANLPRRHHIFCLPCSPLFPVANPTRASCLHLPYWPVNPFLIFLRDRFHSTRCFLTALPSNRLFSDSNTCTRIILFINPRTLNKLCTSISGQLLSLK